MNIKYNKSENTIEIKDGSKTQYWMINILAILNIIHAIIFPVFILEKKQMEWFGFIWIIIGVASIIVLIYQISKKTASEKLNLSDISSLIEKQVFGRKRFSLKLKNGKLRDLIAMKNQSDIAPMKELFNKIGIETS